MNLQNPGALLWMIPLGGIVVVLYLLKMRRKDLRVPATFLWPARTEEVRANALFQRLRFSWLMVLQLVALSLIVFSLARPQTKQQGLAGEATVLVVDAGASMGATDVKASRFDEAKRLAREMIQGMRAGDRLALIVAGPAPKVVFPLGNDPAKQVAALEGIRQSDADVDVGEAMRLASALVGGLDGARIVLLSDGCFERIENFSRGKAAVDYRVIGEKDANLAITALGVSESANGRKLYVGVKNTGVRNLQGTISLYADGKAIDSEQISVKSKLQWGKTLNAPPQAKLIEAKLECDDYLKADNYAATLATKGSALRVLLITRGDLFLERALALDPRVTLDRATSLPADADGKYDVVVFDGIPERKVAAKGVLTFGSATSVAPIRENGFAEKPTFDSAEDVPLLRGVDFRSVFVDRAQKLEAKGSGKAIAKASSGALVVASEEGPTRHVVVAFEPMLSDFPLQVGFPIFVANALDYLGGEAGSDMLVVRPGVPFSLPTTQSAVLTGPGKESVTINPTGGNLVIREADRVGHYRLKVGAKERDVYVSMRSERRSDIDPSKEVALGGGQVKAVKAPQRFADFWRPLGILCLAVLCAEWALYARKS